MIKRGASLIWAVMMSSMIMLVMGSLASFVMKESNMSVRMDDSARAYAAAESGLDWAKLCLGNYSCRDELNFNPTTTEFELNDGAGVAIGGAKYFVTIKKSDSDYVINSKGTSNNVNRQIEYKYEEANLELLKNEDSNFLTDNISAPGSFTLRYYFWTASPSFSNTTFGINKDGTSGDTLAVKISQTGSGASINIDARDNGLIYNYTSDTYKPHFSAGGSSISVLNSYFSGVPYGLLLELKYLRNSGARLTVMGYNSGTGEYVCLGTNTFYLNAGSSSVAFDFADGARFYSDPTPSLISADSYTGITDSTNKIYRLGTSPRFSYIDGVSTLGISRSAVSPPVVPPPPPPTPALTFSPGDGSTVSPGTTVNLSSSVVGVNFRYTTNGVNPTCRTGFSGSSIRINSTITIKAIACKLGVAQGSVGSARYTVSGHPPTPVFAQIVLSNYGEDDPANGIGTPARWVGPNNTVGTNNSTFAQLIMPNGYDDSGHIVLDMGSVLTGKTKINAWIHDTGGNSPKYIVSTSRDGVNYTVQGQISGRVSTPQKRTFTLLPNSEVRYVKVFYSYGGGMGPKYMYLDAVSVE